MKKSCKLLSIIFIFIFLFAFSCSAETSVKNNGTTFESYTYWEGLDGGSKKEVPMKPLYEVRDELTAYDLGLQSFGTLTDIFSDNNGNIYILDSETPQVVILDKDYKVKRVITSLKNETENISFKSSKGIYVDDDNYLYIAGNTSGTVWKSDLSGNIYETFKLPKSDIIPKDFKFLPIKVAVDSRGYTYVLSDGSYYGAILYNPRGEFLGFYGANNVEATATQVLTTIWNKFLTNDVKKSSMVKTLPFQFTDLEIGKNDFVYTATGKTTDNATEQIKILNPAGIDIMNNDGFSFTDKEPSLKYGANQWLGQDMSRITVDGDYIYALDTGHGKIYIYDFECNLLGVFGGGMSYGKETGTFLIPVSFTVCGTDVIVCDSKKGSLTIYGITKYGEMVKKCQSLTLDCKYLEAKDGWQQVLKEDQNSQLAYKGLAKAAYREGKYELAMKYAKNGADRDTYSLAFKYTRQKFINENFTWITLIALIIVGIIISLLIYKKKKNIIILKNEKLKIYFNSLIHPFDSFAVIKEKGKGSVIIGIVLVLILYISSVLKSTLGGFAFTYFDTESFNSLMILAKTAGLVLLWTIVNWSICTLFGGLGKIKEIFIVVSYATTPLTICNFLYLIFTCLLIPEEAVFLGIMVIAFWIYTIFILMAGTVKIHDYGFGKFLGTSIATIIGILIVIFLVFLVGLLMQQLSSFLITFVNEIIYR